MFMSEEVYVEYDKVLHREKFGSGEVMGPKR